MEKTYLKLTEVPRRLMADFGVCVTYRRLYNAILDGTAPATKDESGNRWKVDTDDLATIRDIFTSAK